MVHIVTSISRLSIIILFAIYTYSSFKALRRGNESDAFLIYSLQSSLIILILCNAHLVIYLNTDDLRVLMMVVAEVALILASNLIFKHIYSGVSPLLVNNMCMLLGIGLIMLTRLDIDQAKRQLIIAAAALAVTALVPLIIEKFPYFDKFSFLYAGVGLLGLVAVRLFGKAEYGANLSLSFGGFSLQPAELIKIIFVFFVASRFSKSVEFNSLVKTTIIAAAHVLVLVLNRDLGAGFVFLITYLVMLYVATRKIGYFLLGIGASSIAFVLAYYIFPHVRKRVIAWKDPISVIDDAGYQVSQSLFAIGTGGWFGSGLCEGNPKQIPVVSSDFIFSAICEELGGVFGICLVFVCISCFLMFMNVAIKIKRPFYKMVALGLSVVFGSQVFVSIGGVIKFIPSTGITLPLVSYGGSSILGTILIFAIIQGLIKYQEKEEIRLNEEK